MEVPSTVKPDQSAAGKIVDLVIVLAITFLLWSQRLNEVVGAVLLGAIVQARGAVGVTSKLSSLFGAGSSSSSSGGPPPSDPTGGGSAPGFGLGPQSSPPRGSSDTIQRMATTGSAVGWAGAAWAEAARSSQRRGLAGLAFVLAVVVAAGCLAWRF